MPTLNSADLSPALRQRLGLDMPKKHSKYHAQKTTVDGVTFDSKKEAAEEGNLKLRQRAGEVLSWLRQVPFPLPGGVTYRLDFLVFLADGGVECIDVKGVRTPVYIIKKKQVEEIYRITIKEV